MKTPEEPDPPAPERSLPCRCEAHPDLHFHVEVEGRPGLIRAEDWCGALHQNFTVSNVSAARDTFVPVKCVLPEG